MQNLTYLNSFLLKLMNDPFLNLLSLLKLERLTFIKSSNKPDLQKLYFSVLAFSIEAKVPLEVIHHWENIQKERGTFTDRGCSEAQY